MPKRFYTEDEVGQWLKPTSIDIGESGEATKSDAVSEIEHLSPYVNADDKITFINDEDYKEKLGTITQSTGNKAKNALYKFGYGFATGFGSSMTAIYQGINYLRGKGGFDPDDQIQNYLNEIDEEAAKKFKIFGGHNIGFNMSFALETISSLGNVGGQIVADGLLFAAADALAATGIGAPLSGAILTARAMKIAKTIGQMGYMGIKTATMNGQSSAKDVYDRVYAATGNKDLATGIANKQFDRDFKLQILPATLVTSMLERGTGKAIGKFLSKSKTSDPLHLTFFRHSKNRLLNIGTSMATEAFSEGAEEYMSEYTKDKTFWEYNFPNRINWDNITTSAIAGALAGIGGGGNAHAHQAKEKPAEKPFVKNPFTYDPNQGQHQQQQSPTPVTPPQQPKQQQPKPQQKKPLQRPEEDDDNERDYGKEWYEQEPYDLPPSLNKNDNRDKVNNINSKNIKDVEDNNGDKNNITIINNYNITNIYNNNNTDNSNFQNINAQQNNVQNNTFNQNNFQQNNFQQNNTQQNRNSEETDYEEVPEKEYTDFEEVKRKELPPSQKLLPPSEQNLLPPPDDPDPILVPVIPYKPLDGGDGAAVDLNESDEPLLDRYLWKNINNKDIELSLSEEREKVPVVVGENEYVDKALDKTQQRSVDEGQDNDVISRIFKNIEEQEEGTEEGYQQWLKEQEEKKKKQEGQEEESQEDQDSKNEEEEEDKQDQGKKKKRREPNMGVVFSTVREQIEAGNFGSLPYDANPNPTSKSKSKLETNNKQEQQDNKKDGKVVNNVDNAIKRGTLDATALHDSIYKDVHSLTRIFLLDANTEGSNKEQGYYDNFLKALDANKDEQLPSTGKEALDLYLKDYKAIEDEEMDKIKDIALSLKSNILAFRDINKGSKNSVLAAAYVGKLVTKKIYLEKKLSDLKEEMEKIKTDYLDGKYEDVLEYVYKRFPFLEDYKADNSDKSIISAYYYKSYSDALQHIIDGYDNDIKSFLGKSKNPTTEITDLTNIHMPIYDFMDSITSQNDINLIMDHIKTYGLEERMKDIMAVLKLMSKNMADNKHPFSGSLKNTISEDLRYKMEEFSDMAEEYNKAKGVQKLLLKTKMMVAYLDIKSNLEFRAQRELSTTDVSRFIYNYDKHGSNNYPDTINGIVKSLGGVPEVIVKNFQGQGASIGGRNQLTMDFLDEQELLNSEFEGKSDNDYQKHYNIFINRLKNIKDNVDDIYVQIYIDKALLDIAEVKSVTDRKEFLKIAARVQEIYDLYYADNLGALVSPTQHNIVDPNYDKATNSKKEFEKKHPSKEHDEQDRVLLDHDITGKKGRYTQHGGQGTKMKATVEAASEDNDQGKKKDPLRVKVTVSNEKGEGFDIPEIKKDNIRPNKLSNVLARTVAVHSNSDDNISVGKDPTDYDNIDNVTLHFGDKKDSIKNSIPESSDVQFVDNNTPEPKKGLLNGRNTLNGLGHRRDLPDGRAVEFPIELQANVHTLNSVKNIVGAYNMYLDRKNNDNFDHNKYKSASVFSVKHDGIETGLKIYNLSTPDGVLKTLAYIVNPQNFSFDSNGNVLYKFGTEVFNLTEDNGLDNLTEEMLKPAVLKEFMNDKSSSKTLMEVYFDGSGYESYKDYMKDISMTKYKTVEVDGKDISVFPQQPELDVKLNNTDLQKVEEVVEEVIKKDLLQDEELEKAQDLLEQIQEKRRGFKVIELNPGEAIDVAFDEYGAVIDETNEEKDANEDQEENIDQKEQNEQQEEQQENNQEQELNQEQQQEQSEKEPNEISEEQKQKQELHKVVTEKPWIHNKTVAKGVYVNTAGVYSPERMLKHLKRYDVDLDFTNRLVVQEIIKEAFTEEHLSLSAKSLTPKVKAKITHHKQHIDAILSEYDHPEVQALGKELLDNIEALNKDISRIINRIQNAFDNENKETSFDSSQQYKGSNSVYDFMKNVVITDIHDDPYLDPFKYPIYYPSSTINNTFYAAIGGYEGEIDTLDDLKSALKGLSNISVTKDVINAIDNMSKPEQNNLMRRYRGTRRSYAMSIDKDGNMVRGDIHGGIEVDIRNFIDVLAQNLTTFEYVDGGINPKKLNKRNYTELMMKKHKRLQSSPGYNIEGYNYVRNQNEEYLKKNPGKRQWKTSNYFVAFAEAIKNPDKTSIYDMLNAVKAFGYKNDFEVDGLSTTEASDDLGASFIKISYANKIAIKKLDDKINPKDLKAKKPSAHDPKIKAEFKKIFKSIANDNKIEIVPLLDDNGKQVKIQDRLYHTLKKPTLSSHKPFNAKDVKKFLGDMGLNVDESAVDKFFNDDIMVDDKGEPISYYHLFDDPEGNKDLINKINRRIKGRIDMLNQIIYIATNNGVDTVISSVKNSLEGTNDAVENLDFHTAMETVKNKYKILLQYHYDKNPGGVKATSKLGDIGSSNFSSASAQSNAVDDIKRNPKNNEAFQTYPTVMTFSIPAEMPQAAKAISLGHAHSKAFSQDENKDNTRLNQKSKHDIDYYKIAAYYSKNPDTGRTFTSDKYGKVIVRSMVLPTVADKSTTTIMNTPVLDISDEAILLDSGGIKININTQEGKKLADNLVENFFGTELLRMARLTKNNNINKKGLSTGYKFFYSMYGFNEITNKDGLTVEQRLPELSDMSVEEIYNTIINEYGDKALQVIESEISDDVNGILDTEGIKRKDNNIYGFIFKQYGKSNNHLQALQHPERTDLGVRYSEAMDFVRTKVAKYSINATLINHNSLIMTSGDFAGFSNAGKFTKNGVVDKQALFTDTNNNIIKRMGSAVGTTNKTASNKDQKYIQLVIQDEIGVPSNIGHVAKTLVGKDMSKSDLKKIESLVDNYDTGIVKEMSEKYPILSSYLEITKTDAQEFITVKEAFRTMKDSGGVSEADIDKLYDIYERYTKGEKLKQKEYWFFITSYNSILDPQKPLGASKETVYGNDDKPIAQVMNIVKTAAVPLFKKFTSGTKLEALVDLMEKKEKETGKTVRVTFKSGIKGDNVKKSVTIDDINKGLSDEDFDNSILHMTSKGWGIQQAMPNKVKKDLVKGKTQNKLVLSTQLMSVAMSTGGHKDVKYSLKTHDSIIKEFNDNNPEHKITNKNNVTNIQLEALQTFIISKAVENNLRVLKSNIGTNWEGLKDRLIDMLVQSNKDPDMIESLKNANIDQLAKVANPKILADFHAIIENEVAAIETNGVSLLSMSSVGMETVGSKEHNRIVFVKDYEHGKGLKDGYTDEKGVYHPPEILVPNVFKYRDRKGKLRLIDFSSEEYSYRDEKTGALVFRDGVLDEDLLNGLGVRLPYSNLNSGSGMKIVGILPNEMGNVIIAPPSILAQKGNDNDGDKEYLYLYNHVQYEKGKFVRDDNLKNLDARGKVLAYENALLDINLSIYNNSSEIIQKEISKPISNSLVQKTIDYVGKYFYKGAKSLLTSAAQTAKLISGNSSKAGVSFFSSKIVSDAALNRLAKRLKELPILKTNTGEVLLGVEAEGELLRRDGLSILQNTSVDGAKTDILNEINSNPKTMSIYNGLFLVGFTDPKKGKDVYDSSSGALNMKDSEGVSHNMPILLMSTDVARDLGKALNKENPGHIVTIAKLLEEEYTDKYITNGLYGGSTSNPIYIQDVKDFGDSNLLAQALKKIKDEQKKDPTIDPNKFNLNGIGLDHKGNIFNSDAADVPNPGNNLDFNLLNDMKMKSLYDHFIHKNKKGDKSIMDILTPDNLKAYIEGRTIPGVSKIDMIGAILLKLVQAHNINKEVGHATHLINKTHEPPSSPGELAEVMLSMIHAHKKGTYGLVGDYKGNSNTDNYSMVMDMIYNTKVRTQEGVKLIESLKSIIEAYQKSFPQYLQIIQRALNKKRSDHNHSQVKKVVDDMIFEYKKYDNAASFGRSKKGLNAMLDYLFDTKSLRKWYSWNWQKKKEHKNLGVVKDLPYKIALNRGKDRIWLDNKLLNVIAIRLNDGKGYNSIDISNDMLEDGSMTHAFGQLLLDDKTIVLEDGDRKFTAKDFAILLAAYANFSNNNNLLKVIPQSFYNKLNGNGKMSDVDDNFFEQYYKNKGLGIPSVNYSHNDMHFGYASEYFSDPISYSDEQKQAINIGLNGGKGRPNFQVPVTIGLLDSVKFDKNTGKYFIKFNLARARRNRDNAFNEDGTVKFTASEMAKIIVDGANIGYISVDVPKYLAKNKMFQERKSITLVHKGNGLFEVEQNNEYLPFNPYNPLENTEEEVDIIPEYKEDKQMFMVRANDIYNSIIKPLYDKFGFSDKVKDIFNKQVFSKVNFHLKDVEDNYVTNTGGGLYNIDIVASLDDISDIYSTDNEERTYRYNLIMKQAYRILGEMISNDPDEFVRRAMNGEIETLVQEYQDSIEHNYKSVDQTFEDTVHDKNRRFPEPQEVDVGKREEFNVKNIKPEEVIPTQPRRRTFESINIVPSADIQFDENGAVITNDENFKRKC